MPKPAVVVPVANATVAQATVNAVVPSKIDNLTIQINCSFITIYNVGIKDGLICNEKARCFETAGFFIHEERRR